MYHLFLMDILYETSEARVHPEQVSQSGWWSFTSSSFDNKICDFRWGHCSSAGHAASGRSFGVARATAASREPESCPLHQGGREWKASVHLSQSNREAVGMEDPWWFPEMKKAPMFMNAALQSQGESSLTSMRERPQNSTMQFIPLAWALVLAETLNKDEEANQYTQQSSMENVLDRTQHYF